MFPENKFYVSHFTRTHNLKEILESRALQPVNLQKALDPKFAEPDYYESAAEYGNQEKYGRSNFYSIIFPDSKGKPIFRTHNKVGELSETYVYFIFSSRIIEDNAKMVGNHDVIEPPVFCKGWTYGKITKERCSYYDSSISLKDNLNLWRDSIIKGIKKYEEDPYTEKLVQPESLTIATEIMIEGEMPLDLDLIYIFIPKNNFVPGKYPKSFYKKMPDMRELEKELKKEYDDADKKLQELMDKYPELPWTRDDPFKKK